MVATTAAAAIVVKRSVPVQFNTLLPILPKQDGSLRFGFSPK